MLAQPLLEDLEIEKRIIREEILESLDEEGRNVSAEELCRQTLFGADPLGLSIGGSLANLKRFGLPELRAHMHRYYTAANLVLCVAGAVSIEEVRHLARVNFGNLPTGQRATVPSAPRSAEGPLFRYIECPSSQTDLRLAFPAFGEADPRRMALHMLLRVIDDGMSTRLQRRICDEQGLAYEVYALLDQYQDCGVFGVGAAAEHGKMPKLAAETLKLLGELAERPVEANELRKAQRRYRWDLRAILDSSEVMCAHYGSRALFDLESDLEALAQEAVDVTADDIQSVACEIIRPDRLVIACAGMLGKRVKKHLQNEIDAWSKRAGGAAASADILCKSVAGSAG